MIQNKHKFAFLLCMLLMTTTVFGASEAEYKKLAKTWTLNADGSQEFRYDMELTLFTHTAMNGTYGESFIVYNPQYQELKINSSYTKQKDGTIIKTPDNAFVEVLPRNAADAPAYNHLKEMVVVHTGLELGATIYLDYTVTSKPLPGKMCRPTEFAEVRPATIAANIGSSIQIRIGAAEIHVGGNADLALLRDILRVVSETC